ncbi:hypothetical protein [Mitsuaria sp. 7]|uniref:hypothetical protein n=1 Tax=Mitsuaria sp. 7 TaxID=1658665 RepID=UPI0007DD1195|nr:hypothetical protein [Mitsuaria sp. 7]ANH67123.1 hypothetical protein ABE85_05255 [Mitsuaria sp. 7]
MGPYFPLLQVDVAHGYYADGRCRGLRFVPAGSTAERLRRADALVRTDGGSLRVHGPAEAIARLRSDAEDASGAFDDGHALNWRVFATDDDFACGTEDAADRPRELLWVETGDDATTVTMEARPKALDTPELHALLTPHDRRVLPFALIHLPLARLPSQGPSRDPAAWPVRYRWPLAPRATVWKYCLLGDWTEPALAVVDLAGETGFTAPVPERLDDGTPMLAIRSLVRVPLAQRSPHRFQLRSRGEPPAHGTTAGPAGGNGKVQDKVLIRRLPTAAAQLLARETIAGRPAIVSEIHVHR